MKEIDQRPDGDGDLRKRLERLSGSIDLKVSSAAESERKDAEQSAIGGTTGKAIGLGFRMLADLIAGVLVGLLIGWQLDLWSGLSPLFLIIFLILGMAAGFWSMMKSVGAQPQTGRKAE
jgi:ATP synthase protein I